MKLRRFALITTALTGIVTATSVMAQTTDTTEAKAAPAPAAQEVVVVGIRKSLQKSLQVKRNADAQIDVITAEDVAKFPDTNVAEALSRLPGVTIDHSDGGEGNKVAIFGIDSRLILTEMNGNPLATSSTGVATADSGRSFNFTNLAPELIGNVEVYKSTEARLDEGGVGGTINLNTRKPLDLAPNTLSLSLNYNDNLRTKSSEPRGSLFYSWRNENHTFGFQALVAYNKLELGGTSVSIDSGYETACASILEWGGCTTKNGVTTFTDPSKLPKVTSGPALTPTSLVPINIDSGSFIQTEERTTYETTFQWRPMDNLEFNLLGYYVKGNDSSYSQAMLSDVGNDWDDRNGYLSVNSATNATNYPITYTSVTTNAAGVTGGTLSNITERLDMQYNRQELDTKSVDLNAKWRPGQWTILLDLGETKATGGTDPQYYLSFYGHTSATYSLSDDSSYLKTGQSLTDPTLFTSRATGQQAGFVKTAVSTDDVKYIKADFSRNVDWFDWVNKIQFGLRYQDHLNKDFAHFYNTNVKTTGTLADFAYETTSPSLVSGLGASGDLTSYAYLTQAAMAAYSEANRNPGKSGNSTTGDYNDTGDEWNTDEKDTAAYVEANFRHGKFHGDIGVRAVQTDNEQTYFSSQNYYPWIQDFVHVEKKYSDILPSANVVYDINDTQDVRFSVGKVMARPSFSEESGETDYNIQTRTGSGGNPNLGPYRATNYGLSYENYFAPNSIFSVDVFYRDINQYTVYANVPTSITLPPATIAYCNQGVGNGGVPACPGITSPVDILMNTPYNGSNAAVTGVALSYIGEIKWGFGIQANATWLDQKYGSFNQSQTITGTTLDDNGNPIPVTTSEANLTEKVPMPYLSKWSYTIAPFYEHGPWQAHLSYTWRSKYSQTVSASLTNGTPPTYTAAFGQLDGSVSYQLNKQVQIVASATNILDPEIKPFTTGGLPLGWSKYGTRVSVGLTYKFN
jgi:iron complex outermembrane receptor protein